MFERRLVKSSLLPQLMAGTGPQVKDKEATKLNPEANFVYSELKDHRFSDERIMWKVSPSNE